LAAGLSLILLINWTAPGPDGGDGDGGKSNYIPASHIPASHNTSLPF
jgi:hypothetical protein